MDLLILFGVAVAVASVGFIKYVYYFSVGYGFSIAAIGIAITVMMHWAVNYAVLIMCLLFIVYGCRLGGYLLYRELKSKAYKKLLKDETKEHVPMFVNICIWLSCAFLYVCMTCPVLFRWERVRGFDAFWAIGLVFMAAGIACEVFADIQKTKAKKTAPGRFVSTGLYRIVRCPNYFGELLLWTGVFISGLNVYGSAFEWIFAVLGYIGIVYVMFSGARRLELRQDRNYGSDPEYQEYVKTVPIILPLVPIYSVKKHKWLVA